MDPCKAVFLGRIKSASESGEKNAKDTVAYEAVKRLGAIYHLDNQLANLELDDRKKQRQMTVKPLVEAFFAWVKEMGASNRLPKGKTLDLSGFNIAFLCPVMEYSFLFCLIRYF